MAELASGKALDQAGFTRCYAWGNRPLNIWLTQRLQGPVWPLRLPFAGYFLIAFLVNLFRQKHGRTMAQHHPQALSGLGVVFCPPLDPGCGSFVESYADQFDLLGQRTLQAAHDVGEDVFGRGLESKSDQFLGF